MPQWSFSSGKRPTAPDSWRSRRRPLAARNCPRYLRERFNLLLVHKWGAGHSIDTKELPEFLRILDRNDVRLYAQTRLATRMLMLTFVRTTELIEAKWPEFDFANDEWIIPAERMKMKRPHIVPLSKQALEILKELKELNGKREYVFASEARPLQHMSNNTILSALKRLGYKGRITGHGFRALAMTTIKENSATATKSLTASLPMRRPAKSMPPMTAPSSSMNVR